ncbi:hypothetical protein BK010_02855 [Tenericutes bacterium MO-XQ]|nr:hypothetical protein BK010_02855 [Tenericutes bacterium MO-XQ]
MNMINISKKISFIFIILCFLSVAFFDGNDYIEPIELMYDVASIEEANEIAKTYHMTLKEFSDYGFAIFETDKKQDIVELESLGFSVNGTLETLENPWQTNVINDPFYSDQYAIPMMEVNHAWAIEEGSPDYLIAIIDTGIDTDHPEFIGRISELSYNPVTEEVGISAVEDDQGHGTSVAGVIGANKNNNQGIAGIVQNSKLLVIKTNSLDNPSTSDDESETYSDANLVKAIRYATLHGADVINMSLGGPGYNNTVQNAINDAHDAGVIVVASSGNSGNDTLQYPASYQNVISVGAVEEDMGITSYSTFNSFVDLSAPGSLIVVTDLDGEYAWASGTSFAAPQVTGSIALMQSYLPELTDNQVIDRLYLTAMDRGEVGEDDYYGWGIINVYQAMLLDPILVTFETYGTTIIEPIEIPKDETFTVNPPTKVGHVFDGWYLDEAYTMFFDMGVDTLNEDTTLYAKFSPRTYIVSFISDGSQVEDIPVLYGETFEVPIPTKEGHSFEGWFYDETFETPYYVKPVTQGFTLYAKFIRTAFIVNFYIDDVLDDYAYVNNGQPIDLYTPIGDNDFIGWYLEPTFITPFEGGNATEDLDLYARFDDGRFVITYYDSDQTSVYLTQYVKEGLNAITPEGPEKPSSPSFDFIFIGWSQDDQNITSDLSIYPIYEATYNNRSITILPSLDTIGLNQSWEDPGILVEDELLSYEVVGSVDHTTLGRYEITYQIYLDDEMIDEMTRYVYVVEPRVIITLNPDVTTLYEGDTYIDQGAFSNVGEVMSRGNVDTNVRGTYVITYAVIYNEQTYEKNKYVYVLRAPRVNPEETEYIIPEKKEWMI